MTNDSKLKIALREEVDKVSKVLTTEENIRVVDIAKQWLESLQRINDICKDRNRY